MSAYKVILRRLGVPRLDVTLVVLAESPGAAGELATGVAELRHGGVFEPRRVRRTAPPQPAVFDAVA